MVEPGMRYSSAGAEPEPEPEPEPVGEPLRPPPRPAGARLAQFVSADVGGCSGVGATASTCAMVAIIDCSAHSSHCSWDLQIGSGSSKSRLYVFAACTRSSCSASHRGIFHTLSTQQTAQLASEKRRFNQQVLPKGVLAPAV